ncbi:unnamed protein product [Medioppia subpectinata]|uniref:Protein kinase domain-containing protein n=1 Tax=Medioppia subpectinata TaxID=1979941 RepID=A0A7R9Q0Y4_9ACAR|nr:unnamed protein product [Medioppia subpectinata]CAG2107772.1 unnamed protein product [Medioppia subpectinata]
MEILLNFLLRVIHGVRVVYGILRLIGYGGFGKVYHVESKMNKNIELYKEEPNEKNINREINILQLCDHINVIKYYGAWREQGEPGSKLDKIYIMMEYCNYNLHNVFDFITSVYKRKSNEVICPVNYFISITLVEEILNGLNYLHGMDIMHRDINQSNILVKQQGNGWVVKMCDFGFAKLEASASQHTVNVGTLTYQAPEVKWGGEYNKRADIFSLGVTLIQFFNLDINNSKIVVHPELVTLLARMISGKAADRPTCVEALTSFNQPPIVYDLDVVRADHPGAIGLDDNKYTLLEELTTGAFGQSYKVEDNTDTNVYCIKTFDIKDQNKVNKQITAFTELADLDPAYIRQHLSNWVQWEDSLQALKLYTQSEWYSLSLTKVIDKMHSYFGSTDGHFWPPVGYYMASEILLEIIECVTYLHTNHVIDSEITDKPPDSETVVEQIDKLYSEQQIEENSETVIQQMDTELNDETVINESKPTDQLIGKKAINSEPIAEIIDNQIVDQTIVTETEDNESTVELPIEIYKFAHNLNDYKTLKHALDVWSQLDAEHVIKYLSHWCQYDSDSVHTLPVLRLYLQTDTYIMSLTEAIVKIKHHFGAKNNQLLSPMAYYMESELLLDALECLHYLHTCAPPITHGQIRPDTILITFGPTVRCVKLTDIGLKAPVRPQTEGEPQYDQYMAPEVMYGSDVDNKVDIYSMGAVVQELFNFDLDIQPTHRPTCEILLSAKHEWALPYKVVRDTIPDIIDPNRTYNPNQEFIEHFLQMKYNFNEKPLMPVKVETKFIELTIDDNLFHTLFHSDRIEKLTQGIFCTVFKGRHKQLHKDYAI